MRRDLNFFRGNQDKPPRWVDMYLLPCLSGSYTKCDFSTNIEGKKILRGRASVLISDPENSDKKLFLWGNEIEIDGNKITVDGVLVLVNANDSGNRNPQIPPVPVTPLSQMRDGLMPSPLVASYIPSVVVTGVVVTYGNENGEFGSHGTKSINTRSK